MIITRTPLRISLGGGGTDLPSYYCSAGSGFLVAAAITKYVYIAVNKNFENDILLKYSRVEKAPSPEAVDHPILREALRCTGIAQAIEISSMADIPAGTGLGSSGSFTVGVLRALFSYQRRMVTQIELAEEACRIEIDRLGEPVGKQDQYIAALGGVTAFEFRSDGSVEPRPVAMTEEALEHLEEDLLLFYTGIRRSASGVLLDQDTRTKDDDDDVRKNLDAVKAIGYESRDALEAGEIESFGEILTRQWKLKLERSPTATHRTVDGWIDAAIDAGASGGKLVGAGDGGFLLLLAHSKTEVRRVMRELGLQEVRFGFDHEGTTTVIS